MSQEQLGNHLGFALSLGTFHSFSDRELKGFYVKDANMGGLR